MLVDVAHLGLLAVGAGPGRVALSPPKERAVLEMPARPAGRPVAAELLPAGLRGECEPASAAKVLQGYVLHLQGALSPQSVITTRGGSVLRRLGGIGGGGVP